MANLRIIRSSKQWHDHQKDISKYELTLVQTFSRRSIDVIDYTRTGKNRFDLLPTINWIGLPSIGSIKVEDISLLPKDNKAFVEDYIEYLPYLKNKNWDQDHIIEIWVIADSKRYLLTITYTFKSRFSVEKVFDIIWGMYYAKESQETSKK